MSAWPRSQELFRRAQRVTPGGVNSPARAFGAVGGHPLFIARGEGPFLYDVDGHRYLDYVLSWGPMILGHAHPEVLEAIREAASRGTSYGAPTEAEITLAELIIEAFPSIEKVRLVNSGTEATLSALRLARGYTGRDKIVKFAGNYHGHVDSLLVAAGSSAATLGVPTSPGVTAGTAQDTIVLPYNDTAAVEEVFRTQGEEIAAVIVEPIAGNMGCVPGSAEFLRTLREKTREYGALLIFDEVMTGFRVAYGGAQELLGIRPDLTTLGKIIGGGLPVGAYGGPAAIMDHILPVGKVFQAGTLSGNPLATAAGITTLRILRETNPYPQLAARTQQLAEGLLQAAASACVPCQVAFVPGMLTIFFSERPVTDWETAAACDTKRFAQFFWRMMERGIYLPCSQYEAMFLSVLHSEELIEQTIAAARLALAGL
ncbi:MAG: glutamate-1-semialdehyde 2,1-aminomutase [Thermoguttaceae bacterium]|nr:glutamate-1-semialdehyde 2,1-aminomutase [Thermoguttaceae bacterium]MDW8079437.1 glutamate-1-semialdehyde 2,1-aminomutase [Thermoguttaceae bacterium]